MIIGTGGVVQNDGGSAGTTGGEGGPQLKKGPWTAAEDAVLADYVRKHGEGNWNAVQKNTGLVRCGKSCRLRWANHLRPNLKKGAFSPEEERIIVELHAKLGNKWARMAAQLPGRTDNEIKNYWNTRVKRRQRQGLPLYPPDIQPLHQDHIHYQHLQHSESTTPIPSTPTTPTSFSFQTPPPPLHSPTNTTPLPLHSPHCTTPLHSPHCTTPLHSPHRTTPLHSPTLIHSPHSITPLHSPTPNSTPTPLHSPNHASPMLLHSPTPTTTPPPPALSPTPPPASPLSSPHNPAFPTLPLFDSASHISATSASASAAATNPSSSWNFFFPRASPSLQAPPRFKRFHRDDSETNHNNSGIHVNPQCSTASAATTSSGFMFPFSPLLKTSILAHPSTTSATPSLASPHFPSFSLDPISFDPSSSSRILRSHLNSGQFVSTPEFVYPLKPELPSTQFLAGDGNSDITFDTKLNNDNSSNNNNTSDHQSLAVHIGGHGLLDDLLEEAQALASSNDDLRRQSCLSLHDDKRMMGGFSVSTWGASSTSMPLSSVLKPKEETAEQNQTVHEDLSKMLNVIPSLMQVPEWYSDSGEASNGQSSVVTDDNIGLEMHHIASLFPADTGTDHGKTPSHCSWDNLPGIC